MVCNGFNLGISNLRSETAEANEEVCGVCNIGIEEPDAESSAILSITKHLVHGSLKDADPGYTATFEGEP